MNIFVTHPSPATAASYLCNVRQNKMTTESAQMLSTALRVLTDDDPEFCDGLYKKTHPNHPANIWVRTSLANFQWLVSHACCLANACQGRQKQGKVHGARDKIMNAHIRASRLPNDIWPETGRTPFSNNAASKAHGLDFKHVENVYSAYRQYLVARWTTTDKRMPKWTGDARGCPDWALDAMRAKYPDGEIQELTWRCYDSGGMVLKTQRSLWAEGAGDRAEVYSCVE